MFKSCRNWLSEQWDYGIHSLLNKPPAANNDDAFTQWRERVNDRRERVIAGMRDRACSKQDLLSVNTLGLIPNIPGLHPNPAWPKLPAGFAELRLDVPDGGRIRRPRRRVVVQPVEGHAVARRIAEVDRMGLPILPLLRLAFPTAPSLATSRP